MCKIQKKIDIQLDRQFYIKTVIINLIMMVFSF